MSELALYDKEQLKVVDDFKCERIFDTIKISLIKSIEKHKESRYKIGSEEILYNLKENHKHNFGIDNLALMDSLLTLFWEKNINKTFKLKKRF